MPPQQRSIYYNQRTTPPFTGGRASRLRPADEAHALSRRVGRTTRPTGATGVPGEGTARHADLNLGGLAPANHNTSQRSTTLRTSRRSKRRSQKQPLQSTLNVGHPGNSPGHPSPAATPPASPRRRCVRGEKWKPSDNPVHAPAGENGRVAHGRAQRGWIGAWLAPLEPHASAASQGGAGTQRDPTLSAPGRVKQDGVCRRQHCR